jgi:hypothetical protein
MNAKPIGIKLTHPGIGALRRLLRIILRAHYLLLLRKIEARIVFDLCRRHLVLGKERYR